MSGLVEQKVRFDQILGFVSMYKLVTIGLLAIASTALMLMVSGYLVYSPLHFIFSIVLFVGSAYISNRLFGWLFGVRPQLDSALITGLILALLFTPPETAGEAVKLGLVVSIAMASKYIINIRGKHIFNPAAIAIVVASVSGLAYANWWIATPALLPVTVIVAFLVLYKIQKLTMAAMFMVAAIAGILTQSAINGFLSPQSIVAALTSWPLVFVAGIMLVEPLTLPPLRKQQIILAAIVGVLMTLPLHYGGITMTPAVALVIGNVLAFYVGTRRAVKLRFVSKKKESRDAYEFTFDIPKFAYVPGQYIEFSLPHAKQDFRGSRRIFTMIGQPGEDQVSIATRFPQQHSTFKDGLLRLKPGQTVWGLRVAGDFTLPTDKKIPILCIAGGIGITPFVSFAMNSKGRDITILYAVNTVEDLAFTKEFEKYNVHIIVVTPDTARLPSRDWKREEGRISAEIIEKYLTTDDHVYISGPPAMVTTAKDIASSVGATRIHTDHFSGY